MRSRRARDADAHRDRNIDGHRDGDADGYGDRNIDGDRDGDADGHDNRRARDADGKPYGGREFDADHDADRTRGWGRSCAGSGAHVVAGDARAARSGARDGGAPADPSSMRPAQLR
jgi:hypothetical protein